MVAVFVYDCQRIICKKVGEFIDVFLGINHKAPRFDPEIQPHIIQKGAFLTVGSMYRELNLWLGGLFTLQL